MAREQLDGCTEIMWACGGPVAADRDGAGLGPIAAPALSRARAAAGKCRYSRQGALSHFRQASLSTSCALGSVVCEGFFGNDVHVQKSFLCVLSVCLCVSLYVSACL